MTMVPPPPPPGYQPGAGAPVPRGGVFAMSEVLPLISAASRRLDDLRDEREQKRTQASEAKALARKLRADLIIRLRVWGSPETGNVPIKTSAERQEWADADPEVQQAELDADLAQTVAMAAGDAHADAQRYFDTLQTMLATERDQLRMDMQGHGGGA